MTYLIHRLDKSSAILELIARSPFVVPVDESQKLESLKELDRALERHSQALENVQRITQRVFRENGKL